MMTLNLIERLDFRNKKAPYATAQYSALGLLRTLKSWHERAKQRQALAELDDELLGDIGISKTEAMREANKPFWKR
ncbi:MAG: DUF1127 domain-containing protein [Motiliproteus sp.]